VSVAESSSGKPFQMVLNLSVGLAKANEVLLWGKKKRAQELLDCGFIKWVSDWSNVRICSQVSIISQIFPLQTAESFHGMIRKHLMEELSGLDPAALFIVKNLIRTGLHEKNDPDAVNLRESYGKLSLAYQYSKVDV
jgi:Delta3-Delta2-enoyl-CoA isomerase